MCRLTQRHTRSWLGQQGQAMVEFALMLPLMLIVLFIVVDFGVGLTRWIVITNAANQGVRLGGVGADVGAICAKTIDSSDGLLSGGDVQVTFADVDGSGGIDPGDSVVVDVNYEYDFVSPLGHFLSGAVDSLMLSASPDNRLEQFTGQSPGTQSCP